MKKLITMGAIMATVLVLIGTSNTIGYLTGAPSGKANDPASGNGNCTSCHSGTATTNSAIGNITTNIPASGYVPGTTYQITANVVYAGKTRFGFEVSPQNSAGVQKGTITITDATNTKIVSTKYVTHTSSGNTGSGARSWSFNWTAPAAGTGTVTFYGSLLAANNNGSESGDLTYITSTTVTEAQPCTITAAITAPDTICTLDTATLVASSNPTATSYLWNTGATTSTITGLSGTYTVTVTAPGGCTTTATKTVVARTLVAPIGITLSAVKGTSATLTWTKASCANGYTVQYRPVGTATWKTVQLPDTAKKNLYSLLPSTTYELQMLSKINTTLSSYGTPVTFTTLCVCNPETPVVTAPTSTSETFTWTDDACGVRYKLMYKKSTATVYTTKIVGDTSLTTTLTNLALNTTYNYQFRRECNTAGTYYSTWVTGTFTTPLAIATSINELSKNVVLTKITDVFGREVDANYKDMVIYYYSDGTTKKGFIIK